MSPDSYLFIACVVVGVGGALWLWLSKDPQAKAPGWRVATVLPGSHVPTGWVADKYGGGIWTGTRDQAEIYAQALNAMHRTDMIFVAVPVQRT